MSELGVAPKLPPVIAGRYIPIRVIGRGGMGIVYEVEHARTGERLALKALPSTVDPSPEAIERFKREARTLARIKSENVVRVTDADVASELDGAPFLVMELLEGTDIEGAAKASPPTPATVVEWLRQAARAIDKAHRLGIVHRDLKPENLFLATVEDRPPIIKVLDFGIAKMAQEGTGVTGSGQILGTPRYMAPEQAGATPLVTAATDLYALGMVAYRLIMGETYYRDEQLMGILGQLLHGQLRLPSERNPSFGERFDAWFSKACHKEPESRFPSAAVQIEALAEALGLPTIPIEPPRDQRPPGGSPPVDMTPTRLLGAGSPRSGSAPPGPRFPRRLVVLAVGAVVAATIAAAFVFRASRPPPTAPAPAPAPAPTPAIPSSEAAPAPSTTGSGKPRPVRPRRTAGAPKSPKLPTADPFADQK